jgi:hypothetical protein
MATRKNANTIPSRYILALDILVLAVAAVQDIGTQP